MLKKENIPNLLTVMRIVMIPLFLIFSSVNGLVWHRVAAVIFALASLTDYLDG